MVWRCVGSSTEGIENGTAGTSFYRSLPRGDGDLPLLKLIKSTMLTAHRRYLTNAGNKGRHAWKTWHRFLVADTRFRLRLPQGNVFFAMTIVIASLIISTLSVCAPAQADSVERITVESIVGGSYSEENRCCTGTPFQRGTMGGSRRGAGKIMEEEEPELAETPPPPRPNPTDQR